MKTKNNLRYCYFSMDNIVLYDFWIASQARNDDVSCRHCEEERRSNPETTTKIIH